MVELYLSDKNTYLMNGQVVSEEFGIPMDDNTKDFGNDFESRLLEWGEPIGRSIVGNLGQTLVPIDRGPSRKKSTNGNVQVIINKKGLLNHKTVGLSHEFGHVLLYLWNKPFSHREPGVDNFVYGKATMMSKRLGYDY